MPAQCSAEKPQGDNELPELRDGKDGRGAGIGCGAAATACARVERGSPAPDERLTSVSAASRRSAEGVPAHAGRPGAHANGRPRVAGPAVAGMEDGQLLVTVWVTPVLNQRTWPAGLMVALAGVYPFPGPMVTSIESLVLLADTVTEPAMPVPWIRQ